jgi:ribosome biogenesis protein BRX1
MHTTGELKMTGNSLKGSRPIISFDASFEAFSHLKLIKEILVSSFNVP